MAPQIDLAGWRLEGYKNGWTLGRLRVRQSGENEGDTYLVDQTYWPTLTSVLNALIDRSLRASDAESVGELRAELDRIRSELTRLFEVRVADDTQKVRRRR